MDDAERAKKRIRKFEYTSIVHPPPDLVFTDDMEVINTWPAAWKKSRRLMKKWCLLPGVWQQTRKVKKKAPPINPMAKVWHDYPGFAQGTQGWHNQRFGYVISGSRVGTILGSNPYQTADYLFEQLRGAMPNDPVNHHMIRGTRYEPVAMDYMATQRGWCLLDMPLIHHKDRKRYPILVVSLDRLFAGCADGGMQDERIIVECKCPFEIKESNVALYTDQMQLQMECVTSYMDDDEERDRCKCYLFQYRDSAWSGSGAHEYREDLIPRDPSWLPRNWPQLLDFDQRVRAARLRDGITLEVYNELGRKSLAAFTSKKEQLMKDGAMDERQIENVAAEEMIRVHQEAFAAHKISRDFF